MVDDRFRVKIIPQPSKMSSTSSNPSSSSSNGATSSPITEAIIKDVFALGDVAVMEKATLPATAQVANQESKWLAKRLNKGDLETQAFTFKSLGIMTYIGGMRAIMQTGGAGEIKGCVLYLSCSLSPVLGMGKACVLELNEFLGRSLGAEMMHSLTYL